jgi:hypothetical protein
MRALEVPAQFASNREGNHAARSNTEASTQAVTVALPLFQQQVDYIYVLG